VGDLEKDQGTDQIKMHFTASITMLDAKKAIVGRPQQVYLSFKRTDAAQDEQLSINAQARWDEKMDRFVGKMDFSQKFDLVNGKYEVKLVALDSSAPFEESWSLGNLSVWFKEG